nr:response regulator transcription factor [Angustibacter aerolatus]
MQVVGEAEDVPTALAVIAAQVPDVVLLDVHLPGGGGLQVIAGSVGTPARFLALSVSDAAQDVIGLIRAGARGYVTKTITGPEPRGGDPAGGGRRRGVQPAAGRVRARRVRRRPGAHDGRRPRPAERPRARGDAAHRARLRLQGGRQGACSSR